MRKPLVSIRSISVRSVGSRSVPDVQAESHRLGKSKAYRYFHDGLINNTMFRSKAKSPYEDAQQSQIFLNPEARVDMDKKSAEFKFPTKPSKKVQSQSTTEMVETLMKVNASPNSNPGVDIESIDAIDIHNDTFVERNFTQGEIEYCRQAPNPQASFTGRWSAKEAVFKSLKVESKGAGAPLKEIEIKSDDHGSPTVTVSSAYSKRVKENVLTTVQLSGDAKAAADKAGVKSTTVSISHSDSQVIAVAISSF